MPTHLPTSAPTRRMGHTHSAINPRPARVASGSVPSKVLIVGAGPAGTACAVMLHRAGHDVTVVDKAVFPRDKCCGDGLTTNALRRLEELGFDPASVADWRPTRVASVRSPGGVDIDVSLPDGPGQFAAIAPRMQLDHALVEHCRALGITVHEACAFDSIVSHDARRIIARIDGLGDVEADWVVAADGMWSPVRKSLGLSTSGYLGEWHAFRQYVDNVSGTAATTLHVWFDEDLLPGYAWSFPLPNNRVNFGFGMVRQEGRSVQHMNDLWDDLLSRPHIVAALGPHAAPRDRRTAWPIPARIDAAVRSSGRVLFVGDAVCATDILTGEGIGQALETGIAAAEAIDTGATPARVRAAYSKRIDHLLLADHRMSALLSRALSSRRRTEAALWLVNRTSWTRRNFARWMFEDEARASAFTPRRWHRRYLGRPGAFAD